MGRFLKIIGLSIGLGSTYGFYDILRENGKKHPKDTVEKHEDYDEFEKKHEDYDEFDQTPGFHRLQLWKDIIFRKE